MTNIINWKGFSPYRESCTSSGI